MSLIQWQILIVRSDLMEGYTVWHCTTPLDLTSVSGFTTVIILKVQQMLEMAFPCL